MTDRDDEMVEREIAEAIRKDYDLAQKQARVPPAEVVWMRAELHAREEAARKAIRPILIGQAVGAAAFFGLLISLGSRLSLAQLPPISPALVEVVLGSWLVLPPV